MLLNTGTNRVTKNGRLLLILLLSQVTAWSQLSVDFTADKTGGCPPFKVSFSNRTTGASAGALYQWNFGNGNSSTIVSPATLYTEQKKFTVTLTVTDAGQTASKSLDITAYNNPVVDFVATELKTCLPRPVNFTSSSSAGSGNIASYYWDFGDGSTQQGFANTQQHYYSLPQKPTVSLTVTNSYGCYSTLQKPNLAEVLPALLVQFSADKTFLCRETDPVQFSNSSSGPGTLTYLWDFGDGTSSTLNAPSHAFNKKGIYTVTLTATSSEGCVNSRTQTGFINAGVFNSDFSIPPSICKGSNSMFTNNSTPYANFSNWEVDGVPQYSYYNYLYYTFYTAGSHTIKLKNIFGTCPDSITKTIDVKEAPDLKGFLDTVLGFCGAPALVNFKDTTVTAVKWEWNFNTNYNNNAVDATTQSTSNTYTSDGGYAVRLRVENAVGCSATATKYVGITRPHVYITTSSNTVSCGPFKLTFTANSSEEITSYKWAFSDGGTSTEIQPEHLFSNPGTYSAQLTYTTKSGCTGTVTTGNIQVYGKPVASFTASSTILCGNTPVVFNALPQGPYISYYWYLGDKPYPEYTYYTTSLTHQYDYDSTYTVTLIVINQGGCSDTMTRKDYIKVLPPFPKISGALNTCDGTRGLVSFTQNSKKANSWKWDFGDGSSTTLNTDQPGISHTYSQTGTFKTVLITTNAQCTVRDSITVRVLLKQSPSLTASKSQVCMEDNLDIKISTLENNPGAYTFSNYYDIQRIEYKDGSQFTGSIINTFPTYYWSTVYTGVLSYFQKGKDGLRVMLRSSGFGCADTTNYIPLIVNGAQAGFEVVTDNVCFKTPVLLRDTSKASNGDAVLSWEWNFGDGIVQTYNHGGLVSHTYANPGAYNVSLRVRDASGCTSSISYYNRMVNVNGPKAAFAASTPVTTITVPVYFYNYTNNYNSNNTQYLWLFGDGSSATDYYPTHAYNTPGTYSVRLIAKSSTSSCSDTAFQVITVNNFSPAFSYSSSYINARNCPPVLVRFSNNSFNYTRVTWDFGDGITADNLNYPSHIYDRPGKYFVTLYVYGPSGIKATYLDSVIIKQPAASIRTDKSEACIGYIATLNATVKNANAYLWDFGDGTLLNGTDSTAAHPYNVAGIYQPALMVSDVNGCAALSKLPGSIIIRPNPAVNILPAKPLICKGASILLTASGGSSYAWQPATGLSNAAIASPTASPDTGITYTVAVKDDIGCAGSGTITLQVAQPIKLKITADTSVCLGKTIPLQVTGASTYNWINTTTGLTNTNTSHPFATPAITTVYTVKGTDPYNCFTDTARVRVSVLPLPTVYAGPDVELLAGSSVPLSAVGSADIIKWSWSPGSYLSCSTCPSPVSTPIAQTAYTITVVNKDGCTASDTILIKLLCEESRVAIPTAFTPNGDGQNDFFIIKGISLIKHLIIYDRWGEKVFERSNFIASDRSACWNGTNKGMPAEAGAYVYFAEMECASGGLFIRKGTVILIR